uniref:Uncharacterized protein n=1 Tax=Tanacetum cinerariifolium TaxID=118510 RepID=A0A6L2L0I4_TANCI|nr:hypothetical protein CTI12_AA533220 [Tanacetum cinerariifolium]
MAPVSSPITAEAVNICVPSHNGPTTGEMNSLKVEGIVKNLRESMFHALHSVNVDSRSKKMNMVVELFSNKIRIVLLRFMLGMLVVSAGLFVFLVVQGYDHGPPPT